MKNKRTKVLANMRLHILLYLIENNLLHEFMEETMNSNWWETTPESYRPCLTIDSYFCWENTKKGEKYWLDIFKVYIANR